MAQQLPRQAQAQALAVQNTRFLLNATIFVPVREPATCDILTHILSLLNLLLQYTTVWQSIQTK